ncbi:MAG: hypothetical protein CME30_02535 [Gemmatimonadetes bacterium]|uniref:Uncharacterized protein n=1 Tax=marine metagenome TaxID=408172 RepID=A0A382HT76_9ZZZZ|nr:hypothetical protein [Gemmatimonadota bacterium]
MKDSLESKAALVVGGCGDIGKAVVEILSGQGLCVHLTSRSKDRADALASQIDGYGHVLDFKDSSNLEESLDRLVKSVGVAPDVLINTAGVFSLSPIEDVSLEAFRESLNVNLEGPFAVIRAFLPKMTAKGSGLIVNVGSVAGRVAYPENVSYSSAKYGLRGLHEVLVEEIKGTGVQACLLEPSATSTKLWDSIDLDDNTTLPSRSEMLSPLHVAQAVSFVCSRPTNVHIPLLAIESC